MSAAGSSEAAVRLVGLVGSPNPGERTRTLTDAILGATSGAGATADVIELGEHSLAIADGTRAEDQVGTTRDVLERIERADAFVVASPIYRATYSGLLKNLLDLIPRGSYDGNTAPLRAKPVVVAATAAAPEHFLGVTPLIATIANFFGGYVVPPGVFASHRDFDADGGLVDPVKRHAEQAGLALVSLQRAIAASPALSDVEPQL